jgi:Fe-S-cluster containining protein
VGFREQDEIDPVQRVAVNAVRDTLGNHADVDSCVSLAARIDGLLNQAMESFQDAGIACRAGCTFCCHLRVMVYPHEAIALFRYLGSRIPEAEAAGIRQRLLENATHLRAHGEANPAATGLACAFLVDEKCSAYDVRPSACAGYHSLSRERCESAFRQGGHSFEGTPVLQGLRHLAVALDDGVEQGLAAAGLSGARIELHAALAALIRNPGLIERWRSGRPLVKDAPAHPEDR